MIIKGKPEVALARFPVDPNLDPTKYDAGREAHLCVDPEAVAMVAAGRGDATIEYPYVPDTFTGDLHVLPTFFRPAVQMATSNWPVEIDQVGNQSYGGAGGQIPVGEKPMVTMPTPLKPLPLGWVVTRIAANVIVVDMNPVPEEQVLSTQGGQSLFLDQGNQEYILNTLKRIADKVGA